MSLDSEFKELMPHTVTLKTVSSRDSYNTITYSTGTNYTARVVYKNERVRLANGSESVARGMVWLFGAPTVTIEDQLVLPDSSTPEILAIEKFPDEDGDHHTKVYFG